MTAKHWKFVTEYVSGDGRVTLKEAAIRAGYKESSASVMAWQLTNPDLNPHIVAAIQEYRAELASKYNTSYERHMRDLQVIPIKLWKLAHTLLLFRQSIDAVRLWDRSTLIARKSGMAPLTR